MSDLVYKAVKSNNPSLLTKSGKSINWIIENLKDNKLCRSPFENMCLGLHCPKCPFQGDKSLLYLKKWLKI